MVCVVELSALADNNFRISFLDIRAWYLKMLKAKSGVFAFRVDFPQRRFNFYSSTEYNRTGI